MDVRTSQTGRRAVRQRQHPCQRLHGAWGGRLLQDRPLPRLSRSQRRCGPGADPAPSPLLARRGPRRRRPHARETASKWKCWRAAHWTGSSSASEPRPPHDEPRSPGVADNSSLCAVAFHGGAAWWFCRLRRFCGARARDDAKTPEPSVVYARFTTAVTSNSTRNSGRAKMAGCTYVLAGGSATRRGACPW